ncbi:MAG: ATP synthase F0 subunit B [Deltaproteobacteria bacterium]|nr:ATP synthase F0 subunit B [Deltaproteobacteria bacterium]MBN2687841.1 ATP synthase F0 subunit B [Deltaproteobacteria bacterium]
MTRESMKKLLSGQLITRSILPALLFVLVTAAFAYASGGGGEAAAGGHDHHQLVDFGWRIVNVGILLGVLWWLAAKGIKGFLSGRREGIKSAMDSAIETKEAAQKKFDEYSAKLDKATGEIEEIAQMIMAQGQAEKEKIIEDAKRSAEKMKADASARMEQEYNKLKNELRQEAAVLAVEMAESILKKQIKKADHEEMVKDFLDRMVRLN